uniref:Cation-transporting P-type ATPase C-terminal domain-containing protein n=1 Tax=Acrobeloides nanus TaxID=290746 RepID=A0A914DT45_9BILA
MQRPFNATEFVPYAVAYLIAGYTIFLIPVTTAVFPLLISVAYFIKKDSIFEKNIPEAIMKVLQFVLTLTIVAVVISFIGSVLANDAILKPEQISWITFMAILLTFGLLNDPMNEAGIRTDLIISKNGFKNIICQSLYQIAVLLVIYFLAMLFIPNVKDGRMADPDSPPSVHYTLIFNTFCLMTLFNALNSRKVYGERNIFQVLFHQD